MKIEVHLQGGIRKVIEIVPGATDGATVGVNLYRQDGSIITEAELFAGGGGTQYQITDWSLITGIPENIIQAAALSGAGFIQRDALGVWSVTAEAPIDGTPYSRQDAAWVPATGGSGGMLPIVTGEIVSGQPVFVIGPDGSLIYGPVA